MNDFCSSYASASWDKLFRYPILTVIQNILKSYGIDTTFDVLAADPSTVPSSPTVSTIQQRQIRAGWGILYPYGPVSP